MIRDSFAGQYGAAFRMLGTCIDRAGASAAFWAAPVGRSPVCRVAYHTLYSTDVYLSGDEHAFRPPPFHRPDANRLGRPPGSELEPALAPEPYPPAVLASYLAECREKARRLVAAETEATLAGPSGYGWLPFTRLELHVYNVRHVQHHVGQLAAVLRRAGDDGAAWVRTEAV